jgi:hypothetical protein
MADKKPKKQEGRKRKRRRLSEKRPKEQQLTKTVGVRLSEAEFAELAAQAKAQHSQKATILRMTWLGKAPATLPLPEVLGPAAGPARVMGVDELAAYHSLVAMGGELKKLGELPGLEAPLQAEARVLFGQLRSFLAEVVPPRAERN